MKELNGYLSKYREVKQENVYLLFLNKGTIVERLYGSFITEIEAYRAAKSFKNAKTTVVRGNTICRDVDGLVIICDYEIIE